MATPMSLILHELASRDSKLPECLTHGIYHYCLFCLWPGIGEAQPFTKAIRRAPFRFFPPFLLNRQFNYFFFSCSNKKAPEQVRTCSGARKFIFPWYHPDYS